MNPDGQGDDLQEIHTAGLSTTSTIASALSQTCPTTTTTTNRIVQADATHAGQRLGSNHDHLGHGLHINTSRHPYQHHNYHKKQQQQQQRCQHHASLNLHRAETTILNDARVIRLARIQSNRRSQKCLELLCEEKVSKYKLEEVHTSTPSSVKSTFIMTFSPDGHRVASTHGDHRIYICDLDTGKLIDTLEGHPKTPWCLAWHPSKPHILASGCLAGEVRVWDLRSKACETWTSENNTIITSLDFHPRERVLVIATANDIHFWDWSESEPFAKTTTTHDKEKVKFVVFDSSGTKLITGISNLPKFAGYSHDSSRSRLLDSYLTQGTIDQLPSENMTQNSEITLSPITGPLNSSDNFNERNSTYPATSNRPLTIGANNNEQALINTSTITMSRVASLYRQLEALEDSMRHTSFSPYVSPRPMLISSASSTDENITNQINGSRLNQLSENSQDARQTRGTTNQAGQDNSAGGDSSEDTQQQAPSQGKNDVVTQPNEPQQQSSESVSSNSSNQSSRALNAFEPLVVSFDESLEQLQLSPLVVGGQPINLATVIEQYQIELPDQLQYMMQCESINLVNQNFIRISKLMSSARLYRQIVQQILSSNQGQGHYQPNQLLTAQSVSPRSSRHASSLPILFRNFSGGGHADTDASRSNRSIDPIMAIQFRSSARNVPLVTICKIDLLCARSVCIMRSQQLVEQTLSNNSGSQASEQTNQGEQSESPGNSGNAPHNSSDSPRSDNIDSHPSYHPLLHQLHQLLTMINHAPLTTSNVHNHISLLRRLMNELLTKLTSVFHSPAEGRALVGLIHDLAHSLTGRSWDIPLGATLNDIRLDVVHTLCIVDLALHIMRQVQLLQMQRLSAVARIMASRRSATAIDREYERPVPSAQATVASVSRDLASSNETSAAQILDNFMEPSTSRETFTSTSLLNQTKRKDSEPLTPSDIAKRRKVDVGDGSAQQTNSDTEMIEVPADILASEAATASSSIEIGADTYTASATANPELLGQPTPTLITNELPRSSQATLPDISVADRLFVWNSAPAQSVEQSLHRLLVATASGIGNSQIMVRIYHRPQAGSTAPLNSILDPSAERPTPSTHESRRRALSQDEAVPGSMESNGSSPTIIEQGRGRQSQAGLPSAPSSGVIGSSIPSAPTSAPSGVAFVEPWQRFPYLQVYQTRGTSQHLWLNQWTIPLSVSSSNYRLQCWNFSLSAIPNIKDSQSNIVTPKCRIHNDASIDISGDGSLIACLVPRDDGTCMPNFDLKVFSLRSYDFGVCYYGVPHGPNAISVSLSPSASYAVVGLACNKFVSNDPTDDDLTIAKVVKFKERFQGAQFVRDIKIKRGDASLNLNAIRWLPRGIVYNVGPQHHQRYYSTWMRNRVG